MARFTTHGLTSIQRKLDRLEHADHSPLMVEWEVTMAEDNRRGILAGLDRHGAPLAPVTYRPVGTPARVRNRKRDRGLKGFGPHATGLHGNLSSAEYRRLDGPPLAPRGANSRVITNFATQHGRQGGVWYVEGAWLDVVSVTGVPFLPFHLEGAGRLPKRDIAGVRPDGLARARRQLAAWARRLLKGV